MKKFLILFSLLTGSVFALPVTSTAYNAHASQTDSTPHITASGYRVGVGQAALSRDLLAKIPYGSVIKLVNVRGENCGGYSTALLRVTDTMAARKRNQVDVFMWSKRDALNWGKCRADLVVVKLAQR